jgi:hypothetical protein
MANYEDDDDEEGKGDAEPDQNLFQRHDVFLTPSPRVSGAPGYLIKPICGSGDAG